MDAGDTVGLAEIARRLREGGVALLATDTLPGLHCRFDDAAALRRLGELKGRPSGKPLVVLAGTAEQARCVVGDITREQWLTCEHYWPGPFSFILPRGAGVDAIVSGGRETVAVRVPASAPLRNLILAVGVPLVSSSANLAGQPPSETMAQAEVVFGASVAGIWPRGTTAAAGAQPSTLVDLTAHPYAVLRMGPVPFEPLPFD